MHVYPSENQRLGGEGPGMNRHPSRAPRWGPPVINFSVELHKLIEASVIDSLNV